MAQKGLSGLTAQVKEKLIQQALERRLRNIELNSNVSESVPFAAKAVNIPEQHYRFHLHPGYQQLRIMNDGAAKLGIGSPFFKLHEGLAGATTQIGDREYINYSSYNYLALSGHPEVNEAAKVAIDRYGTSVSASRLVSGERPVHRELEQAIASVYGVDDAIVLVSGHATNVTSIGYLFGSKDLFFTMN
jgi:8-amino-7-oxononanoate synthase